MSRGYIYLHRTLLENPIVTKDSDYMSIWVYLLMSATHDDYEIDHLGKRFTLKRGQLVTGRKKISTFLNISESKVQRVLKRFESEQQIEQQTNNKNRIITILNYNKYQKVGQQIEQPVNNKRTTSEQQVNTNNKHKEHNTHNEHKKDTSTKADNIPYKEIVNYLNKKTDKNFRHTTQKTKDFIKARYNEGYVLEDFKKVIDIKSAEWKNDNKQNKFLRPETLFGTKFEGYLNQKVKKNTFMSDEEIDNILGG